LLVQPELALLHHLEERGGHGHLGGAGHRERHVAVDQHLPATIEIHRGHADTATGSRDDRGDRCWIARSRGLWRLAGGRPAPPATGRQRRKSGHYGHREAPFALD
jgi:hypothetical protein